MYFLSAVFLSLLLVAVDSARILGVFQFPSLSHQIVFRALCRELSLRGHQVTIVTPNPLRDKSLVNLTEIDISSAADVLPSSESIEFTMSKDMPTTEIMVSFYDLSEKIQEAVLQNEEFQKLYKDPNAKFDLLISEALHPGMYSLAGSTLSRYESTIRRSTQPEGKTVQFVLHYMSLYYYKFKVTPRADMISRRYLGDELPYLGDIGRNDLQCLLDDANIGAVYFSLGSNVKSCHLSHIYEKL
nr:unnamed protein product [Callosobruchus chinensis]